MTRPALLAALLACACVPLAAIDNGKDRDGDGYTAWQLGGDDCDDSDAAANPGRSEVCGNGDDDDCDGITDDDGTGATQWYPDLDRDGYGVDSPISACTQPAAYLDRIDAGIDCDDSDDDTHPGAPEICGNDADDNCDGNVDDEGLGSPTWYPDLDQDGFAANDPVQSCARPTHYLSALGIEDCNDADEAINPDADEIWYDGADQDCDEGDDYDQDGDGFASEALASGGDCNDVNDAVNPDATEICFNVTDDDCDGHTDDTGLGAATWYPDLDQDTYATNDPVQACTQPLKHRSTLGEEDCNDFDSTVKPHATEIWYDGVDQDCGGEDDYDRDADGFRAEGEITGGTDCEDAIFAVNPDADEVCDNGLDDDCDTTANGCELLGVYAASAIATSSITITSATYGLGGDPQVVDVTGDGRPDVIAGGYANRVWVFASPIGTSITDSSSYATFTAASEPAFRSETVGDFNGDGQPNVALGRHEGRDVQVFFGPVAGSNNRVDADIEILGPPANSRFGSFVLSLPDFDGNGKDELVVGDEGAFAPDYKSAFYIFSAPLSDGWTIANRTGRFYGEFYDGTGVVGLASDVDPMGPRLFLASTGGEDYTGTIAKFAPEATAGDHLMQDGAVIHGINQATNECSTFAVGDVTSDGVPDILVGAPYANSDRGTVYLMSGPIGPPAQLLSQATATISGRSPSDYFGVQVAVLDFDGDEILDVAIRRSKSGARVVAIYYGPLQPGVFDSSDADLTITGLGASSFGSGDLDEDGRDDLVVKGDSGNALLIIRGQGR